MTATRILVLRHGEKSGDPLDPHLTPAGALRAQRLADYIPATFGVPQALFATSVSKHSYRPIETLTPLADRIGVALDQTYADQDYGALAADLMTPDRNAGGLVVVCWHHGNIPPLARMLGAPEGTYPNPWGRDVFNLILQFSYSSAVRTVTPVMQPF